MQIYGDIMNKTYNYANMQEENECYIQIIHKIRCEKNSDLYVLSIEIA